MIRLPILGRGWNVIYECNLSIWTGAKNLSYTATCPEWAG